jgi:uncharacterized protein YigE (DUF2233 family)
MSDDFEFHLNSAGVREIMQSGEMLQIVSDLGQQVLSQCGEGYKIKNGVGETRAGSTVSVDSAHAYYSNRKHKTLQKALGGIHA